MTTTGHGPSAYMLTLLYAVFVLSGAAGLIYESIWTRYLGLFVGHSAYAQVIVLVMFLGGMSLGALLVGRRSERLRHPLQWYAGVELATGVIGLVFHDVFVATTDFAYSSLFHSIGLGATQTLVKWALAALLILPQSILLGMTFPLMSAGVVRRIPEHTGRALSMLYFSNSLGAAAGVLVAGFWLVGFAGLPGTLIAAALINIAVGGAVFVALRVEGERQEEFAAAQAEAAESSPRATLWRLLLAVSFGTALSSFIYEIGWIRMLALVLGSATHSFELMLSAFILGLALGAFWVRRRADREPSVRMLGHVQIAMGALAIATLPVYLLSFRWMVGILGAFTRTPIGYDFFSIFRYGICLAVMLPATFCAGMTLPLITRLLVGAGVGERAIGQVYGVNTFGSIVGAAVAGLVLMPLLGMKWLLVTGAAVDLVLGVGLLVFDSRATSASPFHGWSRARIVGLAAAAGVVLFALRADFDTTLLTTGVYRYGTIQEPHSREVVFYKDGRTASVSVRKLALTGGLSLATNGKPDASLGPEWFDTTRAIVPGPFTHDASTQMLIPLIPLSYVPHAREAAVIGFGSGMTTHALLGSPNIEHVSTVEIEPEMIRASRLFLPANRRAYDDPRSTVVIDDARSYFAAAGKKFDLILSEPSNPWVSGVSGLFTTEFYHNARSYLTPNGVFAQWLQVYEIDDGLVLGVLAALAQNFPTYTIYQVGTRDFLVVATAQPRLPEPDWSVVAFPGVADDLKRAWPLTPNLLHTLRVADQTSLAPLVRAGAVANSDFYPTLDLNAERTRYLKSDAAGFIGLPAARVNLAAIIDGRRLGFGDSYSVVFGVDRLDAVTVASGLRSGDPRAGHSVVVLRENLRAFEAAMAAGEPPIDWHGWVVIASNVEQGIHGGLAGVADAAFYARVRAYLDRTKAPAAPRAAIDFLHGIDAWNFAEASRAADVLVPLEVQGDRWLDPDQLRDGAVMAKLALGDRPAAGGVFLALVRRSERPITDLRTRLLYSYIMDSTLTVGAAP